MNVQMRNALANTVIHRHERALGFERNFHRAPQQLHILEEWTHQDRRQVAKRFKVVFGYQQAVTRKEWAVIEKRLRLAAEADFAIAIYNPRSANRLDGFARALDTLRDAGCGDRTIIFAHAVTTPKERIETMSLSEARPEMADMATLVIVGNSATRRVGRWVYAPRRAS